jgi:ArsR family transcriptional regulator
MNIDCTPVFASLANETRLRCLRLVAENGEVCVCEVVEALDINQPTASKALNALKSAGLLTARKEANWNYYALNSSMPDWMEAIVTTTVSALTNTKTYTVDQKRFQRLDLRGR